MMYTWKTKHLLYACMVILTGYTGLSFLQSDDNKHVTISQTHASLSSPVPDALRYPVYGENPTPDMSSRQPVRTFRTVVKLRTKRFIASRFRGMDDNDDQSTNDIIFSFQDISLQFNELAMFVSDATRPPFMIVKTIFVPPRG